MKTKEPDQQTVDRFVASLLAMTERSRMLSRGGTTTRSSLYQLLSIVVCVLMANAAFADNILKNGSFDHPSDPLGGWMTDYAWANNNQYMDNKERVTVVPAEAGRQDVVRIESKSDKGTKIETLPIPYEEGYRYEASLKFKGPDYRIYFAGYRWKPRVKPHDRPTHADLRMVYKSRAETGKSSGWKTVKLEIPGKKLTSGAKKYLKQIKYITLYVYCIRTGFMDEVVITRTRDPSLIFD